MSFFVTGTDTGVGKTYLIVQLLRLLRTGGVHCAGFKPICCGDRRDAEMLLAASSAGFTIDEIIQYGCEPPPPRLSLRSLSKSILSQNFCSIAFEEIKRRVDFVLVEGVGGWLVPITKNYFVRDLAAATNLPVLVVVLNKLGCLNHTLLTLQSIKAKAAKVAGLVLNRPPNSSDIASATNADALGKITDVPILPILTRRHGWVFAELARFLAIHSGD